MDKRETKIVASHDRDSIRQSLGLIFAAIALVIGAVLAFRLSNVQQEQTALAEARDRERQRAELIIMSSSYALIVCDEQGHIILSNLTAETTFGWTHEQMQGGHVSDLVAEQSREWIKSSVDELRAHAGDWINYAGNKLAKGVREDGTEIDIQLSARAIKYHGVIEFIFAIRAIPTGEPMPPTALPPQPEQGIQPLPDVPFDAQIKSGESASALRLFDGGTTVSASEP